MNDVTFWAFQGFHDRVANMPMLCEKSYDSCVKLIKKQISSSKGLFIEFNPDVLVPFDPVTTHKNLWEELAKNCVTDFHQLFEDAAILLKQSALVKDIVNDICKIINV